MSEFIKSLPLLLLASMLLFVGAANNAQEWGLVLMTCGTMVLGVWLAVEIMGKK